jgi:GNAT superfamily N-acetyltransferase
MEISFTQDVDKTIAVLQNAGEWLLKSGRNPSKWWQLQNLNKQFLFQYAKPEEFYVGLVEGRPAVAAILQKDQEAQDWHDIDKNKPQPALYIHWLCVDRHFAGKGLTNEMINFAESLATKENIPFLRVDTNASENKLRKIYENLGFELVMVKKEDYRDTALYQKNVKKSSHNSV